MNALSRVLPIVACLIVAAPALAEDCSGRAVASWQPGSERYSVEAVADGPSCRNAVVVLVIRRSDGTPIWTSTGIADTILTLSTAESKAGMTAQLKQWLADAVRRPRTSDELPEWKDADKQGPLQRGDASWYPEPGIARTAWDGCRAVKRPLFVYVQGMESAAVLLLRADDSLVKLGSIVN